MSYQPDTTGFPFRLGYLGGSVEQVIGLIDGTLDSFDEEWMTRTHLKDRLLNIRGRLVDAFNETNPTISDKKEPYATH